MSEQRPISSAGTTAQAGGPSPEVLEEEIAFYLQHLHEWKEHALTGAILSDTSVDSDGIITWLFEEDSFAPVAKLKGEKKYSIITDHLGTPSQMDNEEGKLFWQGSLDSYGRMRMERGETGSCPFRYQGQYEDKEIGLYYNRFRYYSPKGVCISARTPTPLGWQEK